jgi:hypothetical protein
MHRLRLQRDGFPAVKVRHNYGHNQLFDEVKQKAMVYLERSLKGFCKDWMWFIFYCYFLIVDFHL